MPQGKNCRETIFAAQLGGQNLYTNTARRGSPSPPQTPWRLFGVYVFPAFSLENKLFGIHQTSFLPVEALEFSELKIPLVYTCFPPINCRAITLTTGAILKEKKVSYIVGERQFGRHFKRQFGRG